MSTSSPVQTNQMLGAVDPSMYASMLQQQQQWQRNQAMAQSLMQNALQGQQQQEVSGRVVPLTAGNGLMQLAQALMAKNMNAKNDEQLQRLALTQGTMQQQGRMQSMNTMAALLQGKNPYASQPDQQSQQDGQQPPTQGQPSGGIPSGTGQVSVPPAQSSAQPMNPGVLYGMGASDPMLQMFSPEGAKLMSTLASNSLSPTPEMKNAQGLPGYLQKYLTDPDIYRMQQAGVTPQQIHDAVIAKAQKDGLTEVNGTVLSGSTPIANIPKQIEGASPLFGVNANGMIAPTSFQPIQGAASANAGYQGAQAGATAGANTVNTLHTVTGPDGSSGVVWGGAVPGGGRGGVSSAGSQPSGVPGKPAGMWGPNPTATDYMKTDYQGLAAARSAAPAMQQELGRMIQIGQNPSLAVGPVGTMAAKLFSNNAAEYEKGRDFVVAQLASQGGMSTDAARAMVYGAIPGYEAPQQAKLAGLQNLYNQIGVKAMKANALTSAFNSGDSKSYTAASNEFDQNISPKLYPVLTMPAGPARANALKTLAADPKTRASLEWAMNAGLLK